MGPSPRRYLPSAPIALMAPAVKHTVLSANANSPLTGPEIRGCATGWAGSPLGASPLACARSRPFLFISVAPVSCCDGELLLSRERRPGQPAARDRPDHPGEPGEVVRLPLVEPEHLFV